MRFSEEEKALWLEDWRHSGKSAWTYARENGLNPQTFVRWSKEKAEEKKALEEVKPYFVEVQPPTLGAQEILIEKGDMRIHIPLGPVLGELHTVIARLGQGL